MSLLYELFKKVVSVSFNILNVCLYGNLPPFGCVSIIVEEQNRYLVVEQPNGEITFPGGFMRWREYPEQTARRECKEETGLDLSIGPLIGYRSLKSKRIDRMSTLNIIYRGEVLGGKLKGSIEGQPLWLPEDEVRRRATPLLTSILDDALHYQDQPRTVRIKNA
jgi:ADP-ribose pyrophosphatase YjhB (NUDIX family)